MFDPAEIMNSRILLAVLTLVAVTGTMVSLVMPLFGRDALKSRMKTVALERDKLRAKERARMAAEAAQDPRAALRMKPKENVRRIVDDLNLKEMLSDESTQTKLRMAGYRGSAPLYTFLFARIVTPMVLLVISALYVFILAPSTLPTLTKFTAVLFVSGIGVFLPNIYIQNKISKRQLMIRRAWPDALDLMLICVESGMSIEAAFSRVAEEIGIQSVPLAEELTLTNAELSYLSDRRQAYDNLGKRTGVDGVKNVMLALIQAERYGTPVGQALRVMADDNRDQRMQEAEKKAASLPPKLTVPMIIFFLPVLFFVVLGPAVMQVLDTFR